MCLGPIPGGEVSLVDLFKSLEVRGLRNYAEYYLLPLVLPVGQCLQPRQNHERTAGRLHTFHQEFGHTHMQPVAGRIDRLEGMDNSHGADVIIGTGKTMTDTEKEIVDKIVSGFQSYGISVKVNTGEFNATTPWTVSGYAESKDKNNSAVQVELSENIRTHRLDECVSVLSQAVR